MGATFLALRSGLPHLGLLATPLHAHTAVIRGRYVVSQSHLHGHSFSQEAGVHVKKQNPTPHYPFSRPTQTGGGGYTKTN